MKSFIVVAIVLVVLVGCTNPAQSCQASTQSYIEKLKPSLTKFNDQIKLAGSTPRMSLSPVIKDLQTYQRELGAIPPPECAKPAADLMNGGAAGIVEGMLDFMANRDEVSTNRKIELAVLKYTNGSAQLQALAVGASATPTLAR